MFSINSPLRRIGENMNIYKPDQIPAEENKKPNRIPLTELTKALSDITKRSKSYHFDERCSDSPFVESI
jgi:hypothetical protein